MKLSDFDFDLPETQIALQAVSPRDSSRLLVVNPQASEGEPLLADHLFHALPKLLREGDLLVFNDTKVIPARLLGVRHRRDADGAEHSVAIEVLLTQKNQENPQEWWGFAKPGKRLRMGDHLIFPPLEASSTQTPLHGKVLNKAEDGRVLMGFDGNFAQQLADIGQMPLPPYILEARNRLALAAYSPERDKQSYQTVFAAREGAIAAPTASLHFTPELIDQLTQKGIDHVFLTLHVGIGTFQPVKTENLDHHVMHAEWGEINAAACEKIRETKRNGGRVIAVGTTACRLLESAAASGEIHPFCGETAIFIRPNYRFRVIDGLITNFHLPRSTLLMLVSAFAGVAEMRQAYHHAIQHGYRFYSYGDASLLFANPSQMF